MGRVQNIIKFYDGQNWISIRSNEDFSNCISLSFIFRFSLKPSELDIIKAIKSLKNLNSINLNAFYCEDLLLKILRELSISVQANTILTGLAINLRHNMEKVCKDTFNAVMKCIKHNLSHFKLSIYDIDESLLKNIIRWFRRVESLTSFSFKITTELQKVKERVAFFEELRSLKSLNVLKIGLKGKVPPKKDLGKVKVVLPECQLLKLNINDLSFFSLKESHNLRELHLILDQTTSDYLSQIVQNQLPQLSSVEILNFSISEWSQQLIDFAVKSIQLCSRVNSLKIVSNPEDEKAIDQGKKANYESKKAIDCNQIMQQLKESKTIQTLSFKLKYNSQEIDFQKIDLDCLQNIKNLTIYNSQIQYEQNKQKKVDEFAKSLNKLQNLITLRISHLSISSMKVMKPKRLVTLLHM